MSRCHSSHVPSPSRVNGILFSTSRALTQTSSTCTADSHTSLGRNLHVKTPLSTKLVSTCEEVSVEDTSFRQPLPQSNEDNSSAGLARKSRQSGDHDEHSLNSSTVMSRSHLETKVNSSSVLFRGVKFKTVGMATKRTHRSTVVSGRESSEPSSCLVSMRSREQGNCSLELKYWCSDVESDDLAQPLKKVCRSVNRHVRTSSLPLSSPVNGDTLVCCDLCLLRPDAEHKPPETAFSDKRARGYCGCRRRTADDDRGSVLSAAGTGGSLSVTEHSVSKVRLVGLASGRKAAEQMVSQHSLVHLPRLITGTSSYASEAVAASVPVYRAPSNEGSDLVNSVSSTSDCLLPATCQQPELTSTPSSLVNACPRTICSASSASLDLAPHCIDLPESSYVLSATVCQSHTANISDVASYNVSHCSGPVCSSAARSHTGAVCNVSSAVGSLIGSPCSVISAAGSHTGPACTSHSSASLCSSLPAVSNGAVHPRFVISPALRALVSKAAALQKKLVDSKPVAQNVTSLTNHTDTATLSPSNRVCIPLVTSTLLSAAHSAGTLQSVSGLRSAHAKMAQQSKSGEPVRCVPQGRALRHLSQGLSLRPLSQDGALAPLSQGCARTRVPLVGAPTRASQGGALTLESQGGGTPTPGSQGGALTLKSQGGGAPTPGSQGGALTLESQGGGAPTPGSQSGAVKSVSHGPAMTAVSQVGAQTCVSQGGAVTEGGKLMPLSQGDALTPISQGHAVTPVSHTPAVTPASHYGSLTHGGVLAPFSRVGALKHVSHAGALVPTFQAGALTPVSGSCGLTSQCDPLASVFGSSETLTMFMGTAVKNSSFTQGHSQLCDMEYSLPNISAESSGPLHCHSGVITGGSLPKVLRVSLHRFQPCSFSVSKSAAVSCETEKIPSQVSSCNGSSAGTSPKVCTLSVPSTVISYQPNSSTIAASRLSGELHRTSLPTLMNIAGVSDQRCHCTVVGTITVDRVVTSNGMKGRVVSVASSRMCTRAARLRSLAHNLRFRRVSGGPALSPASQDDTMTPVLLTRVSEGGTLTCASQGGTSMSAPEGVLTPGSHVVALTCRSQDATLRAPQGGVPTFASQGGSLMQVQSLVTGSSTNQTENLMPDPSECVSSPALPTFQIPESSGVTSTPSESVSTVSHPLSAMEMLAASRKDRHFLDTIGTLKPSPVSSPVSTFTTHHGCIPSLCSCASTATGDRSELQTSGNGIAFTGSGVEGDKSASLTPGSPHLPALSVPESDGLRCPTTFCIPVTAGLFGTLTASGTPDVLDVNWPSSVSTESSTDRTGSVRNISCPRSISFTSQHHSLLMRAFQLSSKSNSASHLKSNVGSVTDLPVSICAHVTHSTSVLQQPLTSSIINQSSHGSGFSAIFSTTSSEESVAMTTTSTEYNCHGIDEVSELSNLSKSMMMSALKRRGKTVNLCTETVRSTESETDLMISSSHTAIPHSDTNCSVLLCRVSECSTGAVSGCCCRGVANCSSIGVNEHPSTGVTKRSSRGGCECSSSGVTECSSRGVCQCSSTSVTECSSTRGLSKRSGTRVSECFSTGINMKVGWRGRSASVESGVSVVQYDCCVAFPALSLCRECQANNKSVCRFHAFRRLRRSEDGSMLPFGFTDLSFAGDDDVSLWLPQPAGHRHTSDTGLATYLVTLINKAFFNIVHEELQAITWNSTDKWMSWKRSVGGVRELCDVCATTLFNTHWSCSHCGFTVCLDCYATALQSERSINTLADLGSMDRHCRTCRLGSDRWLKCTANGKASHRPTDLALTQIIPSDALWTLGDRLHHVCVNWKLTCSCEKCSLTAKLKEMKAVVSVPGVSRGSKIPPPVTSPVSHAWLDNGRLLQLSECDSSSALSLWRSWWRRSCPVIVSGCHHQLSPSLWHPSAFLAEFSDSKTDLVDCGNSVVLLGYPMRDFWVGFECIGARLRDRFGRTRILKLKDWPPGDDFADILPQRFEDLMKALPFPEYTHRTGSLNLVSCLPEHFVRPDLGPKMYVAYGSALSPDVGSTNLHLDMSDAVNVMMYVGLPTDDTTKRHETAAVEAMRKAGCCTRTMSRVLDGGERPGALWHIYDPHDAHKIRQFLSKVAEEKNKPRLDHDDPIHDQIWYLDEELRDRLYMEHGVVGYTFVQFVGDAVFIPAGAPHQVRNLHSCVKVAEDFVSPENIEHCLRMMQEFRHLSDTHNNHEDKLQIKNIVYHVIKDAVAVLESSSPPDL